MLRKQFRYAFIIVLALIGLSPVALRADSFTWTDVGPGITAASGTLTAHPVGGGQYIVDSGTAMFNGDSMNLLAGTDNGAAQTSPNGLFIFDNVLFMSSNPTLDVDGLLFADTFGKELNIWGNGTPGSFSTYTGVGGSYPLEDTSSVFSIVPSAAAPEPSALILLVAGLMVAIGLAWRKQSQTQAQPQAQTTNSN